MSEWISVDDRLPDDLESVIAVEFCEFCQPSFAAAWQKGGAWYAECEGLKEDGFSNCQDIDINFNPTHWMPLPEPPNE